MKKNKGLLLAAIALISGGGVFSQNFAESALLFSRTQPTGSARMQAMGGAQVSLGGDFSSAYSNPAGLGLYNRSEFSFTPGNFYVASQGDYFRGDTLISANNSGNKSGISLQGLGLVFSNEQNSEGFIRGTFAITLSRTNDFNRTVQYDGSNRANSLIDYFIEDAWGRTPDQFEEGGGLYNTLTEMAYNNFLIGESTILDETADPTTYFTDVTGIPYQRETIQTKGAQNQWNFSYGANFDDKFFLGAGLGVASLRYKSKKHYKESFADGWLDNFSLDEELDIRGSAINLTVGAIARPVEIVQFGLAITTPSYYNITDTYVASMRSNWNNFDYYGDGSEILANESSSTDAVTSEYNLVTPLKISAGATFFFQKSGFISADVERINYASTRYASEISGVEFDSDNDKIKDLYQPVTNIRVGGEYRLDKFRFRAGYNFMPDPFKTEQNGVSRKIQSVSGGFGYRSTKFYIDAAVVNSFGSNSYRPYTVNSSESPALIYDQKSTNVILTMGFPF